MTDLPPPLPPSHDEGSPVAIVTGGARGIGRAVCVTLATAGYTVVVVDSCAEDPALPYPLANEADLRSTVDACFDARSGVAAVGLVADVRDQTALDAVAQGTLEQYGRLDAVVAAAGAIVGGPPAWATTDEQWQVMLDVNLTGVWRLVRATAPLLIERSAGRGRFVAIASAAGIGGLPQLAAYTAAKHGVVGLVKSLAQELAPHGVTANAVCPGSTRTTMLDASAAIYDLPSVESFAAQQPLGRLLDPQEIADVVAFLCSPAASGITGTAVPVDAGMTAD